jgi:hypothetical protein
MKWLVLLLAGCTTVNVNPPPSQSEGHINVMTMPSTSTCILAACDVVASPRATRAGEAIDARGSDVSTRATQKASASAEVPIDLGK